MILVGEKKYSRKKPLNLKEKDNWLFEAEYEITLPSFHAITYDRITVLPGQNLLYRNKPVPEILTRTRFNKEDHSFFKTLRKDSIRLDKAIWLSDAWSVNYFHWFTDTMPKLLITNEYFREIPIIIPAYFDQYSHIKVTIKLFENNPIIYLRNYQKIKVKELIYIPNTAPTGNYNEKLINEINLELRKKFNLDTLLPKKRIFIDRQLAKNRNIINFNELTGLFSKKKIESIVFEQFIWTEQIKIAAEADLLIGVHGAGLTNMLFMKPGSKVLELRRKDDDKNNCYFSLASALDIEYYYLICNIDDEKKLTQENNFIIDKFNLTETLEFIYGQNF